MVKYAREDLLINVAKLYYESDYNQGMIAEKFDISRPFVSKLLHEAKQRGIVTIHVHDPARTETRMEKEIRQKYELRRVIVVPSAVGEDTRARICAAGAKYLNGILKPGDIIGLGSGQTIYLSARSLTKRDDLSKITLVGLEGELSNLQHSSYQQETIKTYADALGGVPYSMPLPAYLSDPARKKIMFEEPCVQQVYELQKRANIAVFTVSALSTGRSMSFVRPDEGLYAARRHRQCDAPFRQPEWRDQRPGAGGAQYRIEPFPFAAKGIPHLYGRRPQQDRQRDRGAQRQLHQRADHRRKRRRRHPQLTRRAGIAAAFLPGKRPVFLCWMYRINYKIAEYFAHCYKCYEL